MFTDFKKQFRHGEKGFTMIELLVVIAILGVLAAVAVPNVGKFIDKGKTESYEAELHNVQTSTMALLADSTTGVLDGGTGAPTADMTSVTSDGNNLAQYITGLVGGAIISGCEYTFDVNGGVTQTTP